MVGLFGFTYNVKAFYGITQYVQMTLGTALSFVALGLGILFAEPERGVMATVVSDSAGGVMARRLYPAAILSRSCSAADAGRRDGCACTTASSACRCFC